MWDLLLLTSTGTIEDAPSVTTPNYTNIEIYFWYAALLIMFVLTIIFIKNDHGEKRKIVNLSNSISKKINSIEKYIQDGKSNKSKYRKIVLTTIHLLDNADVLFIELKEKTRLDDFTKIMAYKGEVVKDLKGIISLPMDKASEELNRVKSSLISLKGKIELVITLIKN